MEELLHEIKLLRRDVKSLHERIEKMEKHTNRMDKHISFVEHLYSRFEYPLEFNQKSQQGKYKITLGSHGQKIDKTILNFVLNN